MLIEHMVCWSSIIKMRKCAYGMFTINIIVDKLAHVVIDFRVRIKLPTVEVRFQNLAVEADCHIGTRALPSLPNVARNIAESALGLIGIQMAKRTNLTILKDATGIIKPSR